MKLFEIVRRSFAVLMLSFMAVAMLPACSSSEESSGGGDTGGDTGYNECVMQCEDDPKCVEACVQDLPI